MKNRQIVIIGAGGHGRVLADVARLNGYTSVVFLDDGDAECASGRVYEFEKFVDASEFFVAIGNNEVRKCISNEIAARGAKIINLIHPAAVIASDVELGTGVAVMAGAVVNTGARIGNGVILNTCSSVDHDCTVGDFVHVSVGAHIAGTVVIGEKTFICAGATVINNIRVCENCVVGAGAVVVNNLTEPGVYKGVPAKLCPKKVL